jgi:hypothetical protein
LIVVEIIKQESRLLLLDPVVFFLVDVWAGAVLEDISQGIGIKTEFLSALTRQLPKGTA